MYQFKRAVLGGTFDRLHAGHKAFLEFALSLSQRLIIGVTSETYVKTQKHAVTCLPYATRVSELREFLKKESASERSIVVKIERNEIPRDYQDSVDAIIATTDTLRGAEELNEKREEIGYAPLPIIPFSLRIRADGKAIPSTDIRKGEIDRNGDPYLSDDMKFNTYSLPVSLRTKLKKPLGNIVLTPPKESLQRKMIVTVGDVTTRTFLRSGISPNVSVVDLVIERRKTYRTVDEIGFLGNEQIYQLENKKSHISPGVFMTLSHLFYNSDNENKKAILHIIGEEDLIVLPVILLAPLGTAVYYGQPGVGMVEVVVTEKIKESMKNLLAKFHKISLEHSH